MCVCVCVCVRVCVRVCVCVCCVYRFYVLLAGCGDSVRAHVRAHTVTSFRHPTPSPLPPRVQLETTARGILGPLFEKQVCALQQRLFCDERKDLQQ